MAEETITAQTPEIDPGMSVMPEGPGLMDVPTVIPELGLAAQALASQVSFAKKTWKDGSGGGTPIKAAELNRLEQGVADLTAAVNALRDSVDKTKFGKVSGKVPKLSTSMFEVGTLANAQMIFASVLSSLGKVRAQGKIDRDKLMVYVFNDSDTDWDGAVCWMAR